MPEFPKLKIKLPFATADEDFCDVEQARHRFKWGREDFLITIDDQIINSYEELVQIVSQEHYRDREFIEVNLLLMIAGG